MQVLAATFRDAIAAQGVVDELASRYGLGPADISVAPHGTGGDGDQETLVAGRFLEDRVGEVRRLVERYGGEVVAVVDEERTRPWSLSSARVEPRH